MRVHLLHHAADARFAEALARSLPSRGFERHPTAEGADLVLVLASETALAEGLGAAPRAALDAGAPVLTVVLGDRTLPRGLPVAAKHVPLVRDVADALRLLEDRRRSAAAHIADGKRETFAWGLFAGLVARG